MSNNKHKRLVGTGASYGAIANDEHARIAVQKAIKQMSDDTVGSVLLLLSSAYAHKPQHAIKEAAKAAGTPFVFGCCAMSLLIESEWLLDVEGAVAMVFPRHLSAQPLNILQQRGIKPSLVLTLTTPNAATIAVNSSDISQIGAITTDEYGHGPYSVWQSGRIVEQEFALNAFPLKLKSITRVAEGIRHISPIMQVNRSQGHRLLEVDQQPVTDNLLQHLPSNLQSIGLEQPYNLLCAVSENKHIESIEQGHFKLHHIVSTDKVKQQLHLSGSANAGHYCFWAIRDQQHAQAVMGNKLREAKTELGSSPVFGLMFPNIGRGPEFFNGRDRDLEQFNEVFPNTPLIGFYGNGEIAQGHQLSGLIHRYSTVFSVFA